MKTELPVVGEWAVQCETCRWWKCGIPLDGQGLIAVDKSGEKYTVSEFEVLFLEPAGECRRYPPIQDGKNRKFVEVWTDDFCGEWAAIPATAGW